MEPKIWNREKQEADFAALELVCFLGKRWWALVDDLRTLPPGQIVAGIPHIGELSPPQL